MVRFEWTDDYDTYMELLYYLVGRHRCGVVQNNYEGMKDFYLIPLLSGDEVAPQLLPFDGPGEYNGVHVTCTVRIKKNPSKLACRVE